MPRRTLQACALGVVGLALSGCRATLIPPDGSDSARVQVQTLQARVDALEARNAELAAQTAAVRAQWALTASGGAIPDQEVLDATPRLVGIALGANAAVECAPACLARLYLQPRDGQGRFIQIVGRVTVAIAWVPATGAPQALGQRTFTPAELRDAYRSGFMGTHYTLEVPLELSPGIPAGSTLAVTAEFIDGWTGQRCAASGSVRTPTAPEGGLH